MENLFPIVKPTFPNYPIESQEKRGGTRYQAKTRSQKSGTSARKSNDFENWIKPKRKLRNRASSRGKRAECGRTGLRTNIHSLWTKSSIGNVRSVLLPSRRPSGWQDRIRFAFEACPPHERDSNSPIGRAFEHRNASLEDDEDHRTSFRDWNTAVIRNRWRLNGELLVCLGLRWHYGYTLSVTSIRTAIRYTYWKSRTDFTLFGIWYLFRLETEGSLSLIVFFVSSLI